MQIFLAKDYREIRLGKKAFKTQWSAPLTKDGPVRWFVEGTEEDRRGLRALGFLEEQIPLPPPPEIPKEPDPLEVMPDNYHCPVHQKTHRKGTTAYIVCYEKFVNAQEPPKAQRATARRKAS